MKSSLVALEGQDVVAVLIDDLSGDVTLAVEGIDGHDRSLERQHLQQLGHGGDLIGFRLGGDLGQDEALVTAPGGDHVQRRLGAGRVEGAAQDLTIDRDDTLGGFGEPRHEALKAGAELVGIEQTKDPAERVVARRAMLQGQKTAQERFLVLGELGHRALPATQNRAQRNHQDFQQIVPLPVRGSSSPSKQAMNPSMSRLPPIASKTPWVEAIASQHASSNALVNLFQMQFPCLCLAALLFSSAKRTIMRRELCSN